MKRLLIWLVVMVWAGTASAGLSIEPKVVPHGYFERMSVERAIQLGYLDESAGYRWKAVPYFCGGGIDSRIGGTKQPVGAGGIRDMRTDLWGGAGGIVVNPYTDASGYGVYYTRYDALGDSISIYRYAYAAKSGDNRSFGAITCGARPSGWVQVACSNYDKIGIRGYAAATADFNTAALAGATIWTIDSTTTHSPDSVVIVDKWYWDYAVAANDTCQLEICRRVRLHKSEPYILVRYKVRSKDTAAGGDSIRFVWTDVIGLGLSGADQAAHLGVAPGAEVGYQNGFGEVRQEHLFDDFTDPVAALIKIGNTLAPADTTSAGVLIRNEIPDSVWIDQGSGDTQALGVFIAFNPNGTVPTEIFYGQGTHSEPWDVFAYDSVFIGQHEDAAAFNYDSTTVLAATRAISFRSGVVALDTTDFSVWEYAIGTVRFSDQDSPYWPAIPKIRFTDGTVLAIPYYRKR